MAAWQAVDLDELCSGDWHHDELGDPIADLDGEAQFLWRHFHRHRAVADFAGEWLVVRIAALRGVAECEQKTFVAAREILQAQAAVGRKRERLAREIAWLGIVAGIGFTVALFVTSISLEDPALVASAKVGILFGSLVAGVVGYLFLRAAPAPPDPVTPTSDDVGELGAVTV